MPSRASLPLDRDRAEARLPSAAQAEVLEAGLGDGPPVVIRPRFDGLRLIEWSRDNAALVRATLSRFGAILFRGFAAADPSVLREVLTAAGAAPEAYVNRSTPRRAVGDRIYTATEYPADLSILLHNEMSYTGRWPMRLALLCLKPADRGGATPFADSRRIHAAIPQEVRDAFGRHGVLYVRTIGQGVDLPWQEVFQTDSRAEVEGYCTRHGIEWDWLGDDVLQVRERRPATRYHPETGEIVWFNQAHLFHYSALAPKIASLVARAFPPERRPRDARFGDGSAIPLEMLETVREVYAAHSVRFAWQAGDLLLLDNMLFAHGRDPYAGERRVLASMSEFIPRGVA